MLSGGMTIAYSTIDRSIDRSKFTSKIDERVEHSEAVSEKKEILSLLGYSSECERRKRLLSNFIKIDPSALHSLVLVTVALFRTARNSDRQPALFLDF